MKFLNIFVASPIGHKVFMETPSFTQFIYPYHAGKLADFQRSSAIVIALASGNIGSGMPQYELSYCLSN